MLRLALRNIGAHPRRLVATTLAVALGVAFLVGTLVLSDTLHVAVDDAVSGAWRGTDVAVQSDTSIDSGPQGAQRGRIPASVVDEVAHVDGVAAAAGIVETPAAVVGDDGEFVATSSAGSVGYSWVEDDALQAFDLATGHAPGPGEVVLDAGTAERAGLSPGDEVEVATAGATSTYTLAGTVTIGGDDSLAGGTTVFWDTATAQAIAGDGDSVDRVLVAGDDGVDDEALSDAVDDALGTAGSTPTDLEVLTAEELRAESGDFLDDALGFVDALLLAFAGTALLVAGLLVANTFSILVAQRMREHALLRAIGARSRQVMVAVVTEAAGVGLVASVAGLALGLGAARVLTALFRRAGLDLPVDQLVVRPSAIVAGLLVGMALTIAAAVLPARRAARTPPVAAMREAALDAPAGSLRRRGVAGGGALTLGSVAVTAGTFVDGGATFPLVALGSALLLLGAYAAAPVAVRPAARLLGARRLVRARGVTDVAGELARGNATRNPRRTAATSSMLLTGVAAVAVVAVLAGSMKASIEDVVAGSARYDLAVASPGPGGGGIDPDLAGELAELPEVDAVSGRRLGSADVAGEASRVAAMDTAAVGDLFDLGDDAVVPGPGEVAIAESVAEEHGWAAGDEVTLTFPRTGSQALAVVGTFDDGAMANATYLVSTETFEANVPADQNVDAQVFVSLAPGVAEAEGRGAVDAVAAGHPGVDVFTLDEFEARRASSIDQLVNLVYGLLALSVLVAGIGIVNALGLALLERTREVGLLRALGMSRSQLRTVVRREAVLVALLGCTVGVVLGTGVGTALAVALGDLGITVVRIPWPTLAAVAVLGLALGVVAGSVPARRAARQDVLTALADS